MNAECLLDEMDSLLESERSSLRALDASRVVSELEAGGLDAEVVEPESLPKQYLVRAVPRP